MCADTSAYDSSTLPVPRCTFRTSRTKPKFWLYTVSDTRSLARASELCRDGGALFGVAAGFCAHALPSSSARAGAQNAWNRFIFAFETREDGQTLQSP